MGDVLLVGVRVGVCEVGLPHLLPLETKSYVHELVHADHLCGAEVDGNVAVTAHQAEDSLDAVVDEGEGAGLEAVSPHLDLVSASDGLPAEGGRGLNIYTMEYSR